jgi:geranylgeranyl reductase family protein
LSTVSVDLAIVGCGVSGSASALAATDYGVSVAIFEEHPEVGYPSHCSGHVGIEAFRKFAPNLPRGLIENEIRGAILNAPNGEILTLEKPKPVTWVINRAEFDRYLASLAIRNGATLNVNSRVNGITRSKDNVRIKLASPEHSEISCKMVIDAGGFSTPIARYMGIPRMSNLSFVNSAQVNVINLRDIDPDFVELYFGQKFAPGFFGWIIPRRDGSAKLGLAAGARSNVKSCLARFLKHPVVSTKMRHARIVTQPQYHPIPVGGGEGRTFGESILTVGDAASQVKPTTGGGIVFGLVCGKLAGETAATAILNHNTSSDFLSKYEVSWRRLIGFDLKVMVWLRRLLYGMPDHRLSKIFALSNELGASEVLGRASDIDFQGRTLLSMARDPRFFFTLLSVSLLSLPSLIRERS